MSLQIPELRQSNPRNVDNIRRVRDRNFRIRSLKCGNERKDEVEKIVVEGKQRNEFRRG